MAYIEHHTIPESRTSTKGGNQQAHEQAYQQRRSSLAYPSDPGSVQRVPKDQHGRQQQHLQVITQVKAELTQGTWEWRGCTWAQRALTSYSSRMHLH
jgi:hypothetical protein